MKKYFVFAVLTALFAFQANETHAQWVKHPDPVLGGGDLGTIFDVFVLKDGDTYAMYNSWRPKRSVAVSYSTDGINWTTPEIVLPPNSPTDWEDDIKRENDYLMFYIGFLDEHTAQIGMARSKNGIDNWERFKGNPIIAPTPGAWDENACYKPFAIQEKEKNRWMLWYNGRRKSLEQMGLVIHQGADLGF